MWEGGSGEDEEEVCELGEMEKEGGGGRWK